MNSKQWGFFWLAKVTSLFAKFVFYPLLRSYPSPRTMFVTELQEIMKAIKQNDKKLNVWDNERKKSKMSRKCSNEKHKVKCMR